MLVFLLLLVSFIRYHYIYWIVLVSNVMMYHSLSSLFLFLVSISQDWSAGKVLTSGGQSCTLWILDFFLLRGCGAVSLTLPLRFINHDQYRTIVQHLGTAITGLCQFLVFQPSNWVLHAHNHRCIMMYIIWHAIYTYRYNILCLTCVEANFRISLNPVYPQQLDKHDETHGETHSLEEKSLHINDKPVRWKES